MPLSKLETDEIRRQNPLEIYLPKRGFDLRKSGRELTCLCPFHREKSPSFNVSVEKQVFRCHGCGAGGDVFTFVQKLDGMTFIDAAEKLAGRPLRDSESSGGRCPAQGTTPTPRTATTPSGPPKPEKAKAAPLLPPPTAPNT